MDSHTFKNIWVGLIRLKGGIKKAQSLVVREMGLDLGTTGGEYNQNALYKILKEFVNLKGKRF